jgi:hypothetical protein
MLGKSTILGIGFGLLASVSATAANFTPNPQASYVLDLDTPDQHMSEWRLTDLGTINALRATVKINGLIATRGEIKPGFLINFTSGDETVAVYVLGNAKDHNFMVFLTHNRGKEDIKDGGMYICSMLLAMEKPFELAVDWTPDGKVTATISGYKKLDGTSGSEPLEAQMTKPPQQIAINGTGGEIELNPLTLGHTSP